MALFMRCLLAKFNEAQRARMLMQGPKVVGREGLPAGGAEVLPEEKPKQEGPLTVDGHLDAPVRLYFVHWTKIKF
jgi:hypothetical protein